MIVPAFKNNIVKEEMLLNERSACLEMTPSTVSNRRLIARVCKPPEFCDRNSCIRKCCAEDEFFYPNKFTCNKLATPEEPTEFHEAFASAVNQTESSAFNSNGWSDEIYMLYYLLCSKNSFFLIRLIILQYHRRIFKESIFFS